MRLLARLCIASFGLLLCCIPISVVAQQDVNVKGYLEHQYSVSYNEGEWTHLDYDRVRVDVGARAGKKTRASVAPVWQIFRGDTEIPLRDVLPSVFDPFVDSLSVPIENRLYLNHAYISLRPGPLEITVGKQYLAWGAALAFNPTELFRPKNALEPTYEREGIGAITARLPLGTLSDVMIGLVPDGSLEDSGKLLRVRHHIKGFDVSAIAAVLSAPTLAPSLDFENPTQGQRITFGGDIIGEVFGLGTWIEAAWSDLEDEQWLELTAGTNYTIGRGTRLMLEAFYNGRGESGRPYSLTQWTGRLTGSLQSIGKTIIYGAIFHPVDEFQLWNVGLSGIVSGSDGSAVLIPSIAYAFAQNVDLLFNGLLYLGKDGSEFSGERAGGFLRVRFYF